MTSRSEWVNEWMSEWMNEWMNELMNSWTYQSINQWQYLRHCSCRSRSLYVFVKKTIARNISTETQWNIQPPEEITWNLWGYKVQDGNHQSWEGDGPYWIGAGARLANCTFGEKKNASDAARFDFLGLDFFKWFLHIKNVKRYVMMYILMDERELRLTKKEKDKSIEKSQRKWRLKVSNAAGRAVFAMWPGSL